MFLRIVIVHRASFSLRKRLASLDHELAHLGRLTVAVTAKLQDALDRIRQTQSLTKSVIAGLALQGGQITDLQKSVRDLQQKLLDGTAISGDDLAAIAEITSDIDQVNADLRSAIPANTPQEAPQPVDGLQPQGSEGQPPAAAGPGDPNAPPVPPPNDEPAPMTAEEVAQHEKDAEAASQAKPIAGTGAQ